ncbi:dTDP-glucose 4,6-dehydratase [Bacillus sp. TS-2]|nr:dTDP-glucose 4,6-dehydratase [Bacillus sp. TS-2]
MNILVTGGAGFIGSNFINYMLNKYSEDFIINYDLLTYAGNLNNLNDLLQHPKHQFVQGDVGNREQLLKIFNLYQIDAVVHFAAESHVDHSIRSPEKFVYSNVVGTQVLLDISKEFQVKKYIQVSTDEVYGSLGDKGLFSESSPLNPNSPYSASKASADMLVKAYYETYGMNVNITRCSNNYGPYQFPEKLIPLMIYNAFHEKELPIYGDGLNVRDWLHVHDHCNAIDLVLRAGVPGEVYNIGGNNEKANIEIVESILQVLNKPKKLITYVEDRLGHDRRYAIDATKIKEHLGWKPYYDFKLGLIETVNWYRDNQKWLNNVMNGQYVHDNTQYIGEHK